MTGATYLFLLRRLPRPNSPPSPQNISTKSKAPRRRPCPRARSTPVRCIRKSARSAPAHVRSAAWRWSPSWCPLDDRPNPELADMTRRFWIGLTLTLPVIALEMGGASCRNAWLGRADAVELDPVCLRDAGGDLGRLAVLRARLAVADHAQSQHVHADRDGHRRCLYLQRCRHRRARRFSRRPFAGMTARSPSISRPRRSSRSSCCSGRCWNCARAKQTSGAIKALLDLAPKTARRVDQTGADEDVALDACGVGDRLRVRPGEKVPVDGVIAEGRSSLDESMVTGESMPVTKEAGAKVIAGTINRSGSFVMRAEKVGRDTLLSRIVQMVAQAQRSRAPIQRLADQVAGWFVPAVIAVAVVAFAAWAIVRARAAPGVRSGRRGQRADHRLSLRARPCDADVDHGRRRPRRAGRRPDQERRGARAHGEGRHAGGRQDRHADRRQAEGRRHRNRAGFRGGRSAAPCGQRRARQRTSAGDAIVAAAAEQRNLRADATCRIRRADRQGRDRQGRGQARCARQCQRFWQRTRHRRAGTGGAGRTAARTTARPRSSSPSTASWPAVIAIADPVKATTPERSDGAGRGRASGSSC